MMPLTPDILIDISLLVLLCITGIGVIRSHNLLIATILLGIFSLLMASMYLALSAPDVAITEAAVGAGISTILLLSALTLTGKQEQEKKDQGNRIVPFLVVCATGAGLLYATIGMPDFASPSSPTNTHLAPHYINNSYKEIGIPNIVTSVLASYRGFDTLGETFVIFTAAVSVLLLIGQRKEKG